MTFAVTHGFHLYDHKAVVVGILTGTTIDDDKRAVIQYGNIFGRLHGAGARDDQARNILARIAADYRDA
jgi:Ser/Thr protein kinase RdoA (MazF antagonist)